MIEAAIAQAAAESRTIRVLAHPTAKRDAWHNVYCFSDEARTAPFPEGLEAVEITSMPRLRKCYGWLKFSGKVFEGLPLRFRAPPAKISKIQRSISPSEEYTAIVYEYIEEGENDEAVVEEVDRFCWLTGFSHNLSPATRNWKRGVLVDLSDIVNVRGYGWHEWSYKPRTADLILVE